ncbi:MAG: hypothetical protein R3F61_14490 [Myxococcota bacterium]
MSTATLDDAAFDRSLARQYANATWGQLVFAYIGGPFVCVVASFLPLGTLMVWVTLLLIIAAALASVTRTVRMPKALRAQANPAEMLVLLGAGILPVLTVGVPLALYALWLVAAGALVSAGIF